MTLRFAFYLMKRRLRCFSAWRFLTAAWVVLGLFPTTFVKLMDPLTQQLVGRQLSEQLSVAGGFVLAGAGCESGTLSTLGILSWA